MRILTVCSSWRVFGAETITLKLLEGFKRRGHEQFAITSIWTDGDLSRRLENLKIPHEAMPFGAVVASLSPRYLKWSADCLVRLPILWWKWHRVLRTFRPDVILWTGSKQAMLLLPWLGRTPSFVVEHGSPSATKSVRRLYRLLSNKLTGFITVSDFMFNQLKEAGAPPEKIHVIKNGVLFHDEHQDFDDVSVVFLERGAGPVRIGIAGQVARSKGHDCLVDAVQLLNNRGIKLEVRVFGTGNQDYTRALKAKIQNAGLTGVWNWRGYEQNKRKIFQSFDVCVVPSCFGDPFPTVAMEAGVYALPVVASRIGGLPEIIEDGVTGFLVEPNSPAQLADKIKYLIDNPQRAREMGMAGRERIFKEFTVEKMVAGFELLFDKLK